MTGEGRRPAELDQSGEITSLGRPSPANLSPLIEAMIDPIEELVEPVEDEITAQHLILARGPGQDESEQEEELPPLPGDQDEAAPQPSEQTREPSTDRIGPKDAPISKRQG